MSPIPSMPYEILWGERVIRSVANLKHRDGVEFIDLAACVTLDITVKPHPLAEANAVLQKLRQGELTGAAVLVPHA